MRDYRPAPDPRRGRNVSTALAAAAAAAAELIRRWAAQTAKLGTVDDLDNEVATDVQETSLLARSTSAHRRPAR